MCSDSQAATNFDQSINVFQMRQMTLRTDPFEIISCRFEAKFDA